MTLERRCVSEQQRTVADLCSGHGVRADRGVRIRAREVAACRNALDRPGGAGRALGSARKLSRFEVASKERAVPDLRSRDRPALQLRGPDGVAGKDELTRRLAERRRAEKSHEKGGA